MNKKEIIQKYKNQGYSIRKIALELNVHHSTIINWIKNDFNIKPKLQADFKIKRTREAYAYILGLYLGDGYIIKTLRTYKLMIAQDAIYKNLIEKNKKEFNILFPSNKVNVSSPKNSNVKNIYVYSNLIKDLFPHVGVGSKDQRKIVIQNWQSKIINENSWQFLEGLIHSDGSIYFDRGYEMIVFTNKSKDIVELFLECCNRLNINYTVKNPSVKRSCYDIFIRKRSSVIEIKNNIMNKNKYVI